MDWIDSIEEIGKINCAYYAMLSLLSWTAKELSDDERFGVYNK